MGFGGVIVLLIVAAAIIGLIVFLIVAMISNSQNKQLAIEKKGASVFGVFNHVNGLPIAENILCQVSSLPDKYEINANGATFNLDKNKVTDVCIKTDVEIQNQYVSSVGGAVGGALLFGPLGAIIGGRAKKKTSKVINRYLIFTYQNNDEIKYVGFDVTNNFAATKFVDEFMKNKQSQNVSIDL